MVISCMYWFKGLEQDEYYVKTLSSIVFFLLFIIAMIDLSKQEQC